MAQLGLILAQLGPSWPYLEPTWDHLGPTWGPSWIMMGPPRPNMAPTWVHLGSTWASLRPAWAHMASLMDPESLKCSPCTTGLQPGPHYPYSLYIYSLAPSPNTEKDHASVHLEGPSVLVLILRMHCKEGLQGSPQPSWFLLTYRRLGPTRWLDKIARASKGP